jgi:hypothetical protein
MRTLMVFSVVAVAVLLAAGCSNIKLTEDGQNVQVFEQLQILEQCQMLGKVTTNARNVNRTQEDKDRAILARNEAAKMGGNVIVAQGEVVDNAQEFNVYRCP